MKKDNKSLIQKLGNFQRKITETISSLTLTEKVVFVFSIIILLFSVISSLIKINANYLIEIPQRGGEIKEGLIGAPRFINPIIALSNTDRDISSLVYSGLVKINIKGEVENDLAEKISISDDKLTYSVKIKDDAFFHDGEPVTSDDVIFSINKTQDPKIKSPKRPSWDGVIVEKINDKEVNFILNRPYSPFIYNLSMGIIPKHIWKDISSDEFAFSKYNLKPIGSGPYVVKSIKQDGDGIIKKFNLESYKRYTLGEPYIKKISFYFYKNEENLITALNKNQINSAHSISPEKIKELKLENQKLITAPFSRIFALYLNQSENNALAQKVVRKALNIVAPKKEIVDEILKEFGHSINSPIPLNISKSDNLFENENIEEAQEILLKNGWKKGEDGIFVKETKKESLRLQFSISTANVNELVKVTEKLADSFKKLGAEVNVKIFEPNDLTLNAIRPREFESIFFGQVVNRDLDFFAFWHSSQRNDPGLNIAGFANITADKVLEKLRESTNKEEKEKNLQIFEKEVINDLPAIFLYSPDFIYIVPKNLKLEIPDSIVISSDRFADIEKWYTKTDLVWKIFKK